MEDAEGEKMAEEARRVSEEAHYRADMHFRTAHFWNKFDYIVGIPTAVLAAVAGGTALASYHVLAGVLALITAVLIAISTFLEPDEEENRNHYFANEYVHLENNARIFADIESKVLKDPVMIVNELKDLTRRQAELNKGSPHVPWFVWRMTRKNLRMNEPTHVMRA